jgi:Fe-S cluster assembly ATP-binding protein
MLEIKNLEVHNKDTQIINGLDLKINKGEVHVIMGPNGSGKSTFARSLVKDPDYQLKATRLVFEQQELTNLAADEISHLGMFLGFQYPMEIPGVSNVQFLKSIVNAKRRLSGLEPLDAVDFLANTKELMQLLDMNEELLYRSVNTDFSGGEKKRNEILQMLLLQPKLAILDEIDSGLDIDALKAVANGINKFVTKDTSIILITHYQRLLDYIKPDHVHIMHKGKIELSGGMDIVEKLEKEGYKWLAQN